MKLKKKAINVTSFTEITNLDIFKVLGLIENLFI